MEQKTLIIASLLAMLFIILVYAFTHKPAGGFGGEIILGNSTISPYELSFKINSAKSIAIIMDAREVAQPGKVKVYECAVGFAGSIAMLNKTVKNFAIDADYCIKNDMNKTSINECNKLAHESDYIILIKGTANSSKTEYYEDHIYVEVPIDYEKECGIRIK